MQTQGTILVLEDDLNLMEGIRDILQLQHYQVLTASNGEQGLRVLKTCELPPDLILSDIMMPVMDGYQFLEEIRREQRLMMVPFIFLTAKGEKSDVRTGKLLGADDYLVKPFEAEDLIAGVSAKLRRHRELNQVQAEQVSDIKRRILTILHHEFRTPLTYVIAYSDLLNREFSELSREELQSFLGGLASGADRLRRLVENLILLVELETGEAESTFNWRKRPLDHNQLAKVFEDAILELQSFAESRHIQLVLDSPADNLPTITADPEYLKGAVARLIENGIKFNNKPDAFVRVRTEIDANYMWVLVEDNGRGIPQAELNTIFDVFHQVKREVYEDQGAGAGLPIVRRIVDLHKGCIDVKSKVGEGSQFMVGIPRSA
jgi:signal transduction histidine kinase